MNVVRFAVRHERRAIRIALGTFAALVLSSFVCVVLAPHALAPLFALLMGVTMLGWGVAMIAAWFGGERRAESLEGGISGFAGRAFALGGTAFLVAWFAAGVALVGAAVLLSLAW